MLLDIVKAVIMGIVEGITEFLPISSTGHLIVAGSLLQFNALGSTFEIFIQLGAVIAVALYFRLRLLEQVQTITQPRTQRFWLAILVAFVPAAVVGFLLIDWIDANLFNSTTVAISLIVGGIAFIIIEAARKQQQTTRAPEPETAVEDISLRQALLIGITQILALIPGVSRSGATIIAGMLVGLSRPAATEFSFYLSIPTLGLATLYALLRSLDSLTGDQAILLGVGMVVSGVVAWFAIDWLLRYVRTNTFTGFGIYRIIAGAVILLLVALQAIPR
jgi:undecaprenyl-diphosphatase